jgi:hypothetical protein
LCTTSMKDDVDGLEGEFRVKTRGSPEIS